MDGTMVKCKGRAKGKVYIPKKHGFKIWCCSCSCYRYLCNFDVYTCSSRPTHPRTGQPMSEEGQVVRVVKDIVQLYHDDNHVLYCDNYFTSGPLAADLAKKKVFNYRWH